MELLKDIEAQGERQVHSVLEEADRQAKSLLEAGRARARVEVEALERQWLAQLDQERMRLVNTAQTKAQQRLSQTKEGWVQHVLEQLEREARQLRSQPDHYLAFLKRILRETEAALSGPLRLEIDPADQACFESLLQGKPHRIAKHLQTWGGFVAHNEAQDVTVDNRLEIRLSGLKRALRAQLGTSLLGAAGIKGS